MRLLDSLLITYCRWCVGSDLALRPGQEIGGIRERRVQEALPQSAPRLVCTTPTRLVHSNNLLTKVQKPFYIYLGKRLQSQQRLVSTALCFASLSGQLAKREHKRWKLLSIEGVVYAIGCNDQSWPGSLLGATAAAHHDHDVVFSEDPLEEDNLVLSTVYPPSSDKILG